MKAFIRKLNFSCDGLGKEATLLFTFDDPESNPKIYEGQYPVCWKVITFGATGSYDVDLVYKNQLAFIRPQVDSGTISKASTFMDIGPGQKTILTVDVEGSAKFSAPEADAFLINNNMSKAVNKSGNYQDISIGFYADGEDRPTPALYFPKIGNGLDVAVQFIPVLRLYVTNRLRDTTIMCGTMDPTTAIWSHNLAGLADSSSWVLYMDDVGAYHIKQA